MSKFISIEEAVSKVKDGMTIMVGGCGENGTADTEQGAGTHPLLFLQKSIEGGNPIESERASADWLAGAAVRHAQCGHGGRHHGDTQLSL